MIIMCTTIVYCFLQLYDYLLNIVLLYYDLIVYVILK